VILDLEVENQNDRQKNKNKLERAEKHVQDAKTAPTEKPPKLDLNSP
jgi:hypothetical protein